MILRYICCIHSMNEAVRCCDTATIPRAKLKCEEVERAHSPALSASPTVALLRVLHCQLMHDELVLSSNKAIVRHVSLGPVDVSLGEK